MVSLGLLLIPLLDKIMSVLQHYPTNAYARFPGRQLAWHYYLFIHLVLLCWWKLIFTVLTLLTCLG